MLESGRSFRGFILICYGLNVAAGIAIWGFVVATGLVDSAVPGVGDRTFLLLAAIVCSTIFYVQDGVLAAWRKSWLILLENLLYNVVKLALLVALSSLRLPDAITLSWFLPMPFFSLVVAVIVFGRSWRRRPEAAHDRENAIPYRQAVSVVGYDYLGGLLNEVSIRLLPLIVFNTLGGAEAGFFFQGWLVANTIRLVLGSFATSFTVAVAASPETVVRSSRSALVNLMVLVTIGALGLVLVAPFLLSVIGRDYAENSTTILRLLAVSSIPMAANTWFIAFARLRNWGGAIMINYVVQGVLTTVAVLLLAPSLGLVGVGLACILGQFGAMLQAYGPARRVLTATPVVHSAGRSGLSQMLRKVDWRFLTQTPWPRRVACLDPEIAAALRQCGAEVASPAQTATDCNLAFVKGLSTGALRSASASLAPGGAVFCRAGFVPIFVARRRFAKAGLSLQGGYIGVPSLQQPRFFLPLPPRPEMVRFLLGRAFGELGPLSRFLSSPLAWGVGVLGFLGGFPQVGFVGVRAVGGGVAEKALCAFAGTGCLITTPGRQAMSVICSFRWPDGATWPAIVVKRSRTRGGDALLQRRAAMLRRLADIDLKVVADVPSLEFIEVAEGSAVLGESFVPGKELSPDGSRAFMEMANQVTDFAIYLGRRTLLPCAAHAAQSLRMLNRLEQRGVLDKGAAAVIRARLPAADALPCVLAHNDLAPWNTVLNRSRLGVLDWGEADSGGVPGADLVYMLFQLAFKHMGANGRRETVEAYTVLLGEEIAEAAAIRDCLGRYCDALGIDVENLPLIRLLTWIFHAESELSYVADEFDPSISDTLGADSSMLGLLYAELSIMDGEAPSPQV